MEYRFASSAEDYLSEGLYNIIVQNFPQTFRQIDVNDWALNLMLHLHSKNQTIVHRLIK